MAWLGAVVGALGMLGQNQQAQSQMDAQNRALDLQEQGLDLNKQLSAPQIAALNAMLGLAQNYNPQQEAQAGIGRATDVFNAALTQGLGNTASQFASGGSMPGMSSEFNVRSQDVANRVSDPFRAYLADAEGNQSQKKADMYRMVLASAPSGNLSDAYFKASGQNMNMAGMYHPDYGPSLAALGGSLQKLFAGGGGQGSGVFNFGAQNGAMGGSAMDPFGNVGTSNPYGLDFGNTAATNPTSTNPTSLTSIFGY